MLQCSMLHATKSHMSVLHCSIRLTACSIQSIQFLLHVVIFSWDRVEEALIGFIVLEVLEDDKKRPTVRVKHGNGWKEDWNKDFLFLCFSFRSLSFLQCLFFVRRWRIMRLKGSALSVPVLHDGQKDLITTEILISTKNLSFYSNFFLRH